MALKSLLAFILSSALVLNSGCSEAENSKTPDIWPNPNILLIVADDLGLLDAGAYGGEIRTPHIDWLASNGIRYSNFYTAATCSVTRSMLMTGVDSHAAGLGNMMEHLAPNQKGKEGYEGHLSRRVASVASLLQDAGYRTYMAGKWHLGKKGKQLPAGQGFDQSFALLQGGATYFNDMRGLAPGREQAHYAHNENFVTELPDDFYATEFYADFVLDRLEADRNSERPFFTYLAFSAPHWPLQVKEEHLDLYEGRYSEGYEVIYQQRIAAAKAIGILPEHSNPPMPSYVVPWEQLSDDQKRVQEKNMELYAAVVERMDFHIGRVLKYLEDTGELDNTFVVFMSDNGASGADFLAKPTHSKWLKANWNLSYENMGRRGSYVFQGPGWAWASTGPYRMYKQYTSEGGMKVPLIISYPESRRKGALDSQFLTVKDIVPTLLELAGIDHPGSSFQGRAIKPLEGVSMLPAIIDSSNKVSEAERVMAWEQFGHKAVRKGDWKLLWLTSKAKWLRIPEGADVWGLYNIAKDPGETINRASQEPEKFAELMQIYSSYAEEQKIIAPVWE